MRDIKFRGRISAALENGGTWLYWGIAGTDMIDVIDPDSVGQYTGLKDKNGVEIYDKDFLQHPDFDFPILVEWNKNDACFESRGAVSEWEFCEVVGNVYETPEFLEDC